MIWCDSHRSKVPFAVCLMASLATVAASPLPQPSLQIIQPEDGSSISGPDVTVRTEVVGVELGSRSRSGAYLLLRIDSLPAVKSYSERFTFKGLARGEHELRAELRRSDGRPLEPAVMASARFSVVGGN